MPTDPITYVPISSLAGHTDDEPDSEPTQSPQHAQQRKATSVAKKGKSKSVGSSKKDKKKMHAATEPVDDYDVDVIPSPPPTKKRKTMAAKKKGKKKMTPAEIVHYYSSTSKEHTSSPVQAEKVTWEEVMSFEDGDDEVEITKEVHSSVVRTFKQMAESAKRRPRLQSSS